MSYTSKYTGTEIDGLLDKANGIDMSQYLTQESEPAFNGSAAKSITQQDIEAWNNKSTFGGSYNDLTDKPTIPSIEGLATQSYVDTKVADLVNQAPGTMDTLAELAAALGNDPNFATSTATLIGQKVAQTQYDTDKAGFALKSEVQAVADQLTGVEQILQNLNM